MDFTNSPLLQHAQQERKEARRIYPTQHNHQHHQHHQHLRKNVSLEDTQQFNHRLRSNASDLLTDARAEFLERQARGRGITTPRPYDFGWSDERAHLRREQKEKVNAAEAQKRMTVGVGGGIVKKKPEPSLRQNMTQKEHAENHRLKGRTKTSSFLADAAADFHARMARTSLTTISLTTIPKAFSFMHRTERARKRKQQKIEESKQHGRGGDMSAWSEAKTGSQAQNQHFNTNLRKYAGIELTHARSAFEARRARGRSRTTPCEFDFGWSDERAARHGPAKPVSTKQLDHKTDEDRHRMDLRRREELSALLRAESENFKLRMARRQAIAASGSRARGGSGRGRGSGSRQSKSVPRTFQRPFSEPLAPNGGIDRRNGKRQPTKPGRKLSPRARKDRPKSGGRSNDVAQQRRGTARTTMHLTNGALPTSRSEAPTSTKVSTSRDPRRNSKRATRVGLESSSYKTDSTDDHSESDEENNHKTKSWMTAAHNINDDEMDRGLLEIIHKPRRGSN